MHDATNDANTELFSVRHNGAGVRVVMHERGVTFFRETLDGDLRARLAIVALALCAVLPPHATFNTCPPVEIQKGPEFTFVHNLFRCALDEQSRLRTPLLFQLRFGAVFNRTVRRYVRA